MRTALVLSTWLEFVWLEFVIRAFSPASASVGIIVPGENMHRSIMGC
jgi:hypothetical protein